MSTFYYLCGIFSLCAVTGCRTPQKISTPSPAIEDTKIDSATLDCIGLGPDPEHISTKCNLKMRALVPVKIEKGKKIAIQIPKNGQKHVITCARDIPWIGQLEDFLIAKCDGLKIWIYWVNKTGATDREKTNFSTIYSNDVSSSRIFDGDEMTEYIIRKLNRYDVVWFDQVGTDNRTPDEIIGDTTNRISKTSKGPSPSVRDADKQECD